MKRTFLHTVFSLFFAAMFLFAGTGYNLIRYCCNDCRNLGIEKVIEISCECVHRHHFDHNESSNHHHAACNREQSKGCDMQRLVVDTPPVHLSGCDWTDYFLLFSNLACLPANFLSFDNTIEKPHSCIPPDTLPLRAGRQILSNISTLII